MNRTLTILSCLLIFASTTAQQAPDTLFAAKLKLNKTQYDPGKGPVVLIDGAHNNFHRSNGNFAPLKILLEKDGYDIKSLDSSSTKENLSHCHILVISNALAANNVDRWYLPVYSAFTETEVKTIKNWVDKGGRLLFIADHMPFAGAADVLAKAFGFNFINGFADNNMNGWPPSVFRVKDKTMTSSIAEGRNSREKVDSVAAFTGSAFSYPSAAQPVLLFTAKDTVIITDTAWRINDKTIRQSLASKAMGAIMKSGKGRIAVFGEAAMFTAQLRRDDAVGFNAPEAPQNIQFILNLFHWLDTNAEH
ncbi:MAG TPA: hypothetical protein PKG90_12080 [Chitinophagaceae bacterium]|nr:hypothetical protein [Chitinophagaceae bacterium]HNU14506.1 hypothetical protein [Chitinophagaceae bacterium]